MVANHERFKNLTAGIQSIVLSLAVLVGGFWTLSTFNLLQQREQAVQALARLKEPPAVDIEISAETPAPPEFSAGRLLLVTVVLKNDGERTALLNLNKPLQVWQVAKGADQKIGYEKPMVLSPLSSGNPNYSNQLTVSVRPHGLETLVFAAWLKNPGIFLLSFAVDIPITERASTVEGGENLVRWHSSKFIEVPAKQNSSLDSVTRLHKTG